MRLVDVPCAHISRMKNCENGALRKNHLHFLKLFFDIKMAKDDI